MKTWNALPCENMEYLNAILDFLLVRYSELLGPSVMNREPCTVYNDPNADCPMLVINSSPVSIRLAQPSLDYWAQTIYQLSHELCHYAMRQHKSDKAFTLYWYEEIICEAASLYFLEYAAKNWRQCALSPMNPGFSHGLADYLAALLEEKGNDVFRQCNTQAKLRAYEQYQSTDRATHLNERNQVYRRLSADPSQLAAVCPYMDYLRRDRLTIDFDRWLQAKDCALLRDLRAIQPVKPTAAACRTGLR